MYRWFVLYLYHKMIFKMKYVCVLLITYNSTGRYLFSGNHDGMVTVWDTQQPPVKLRPDTDFVLESFQEFRAHTDTVNGIRYVSTTPKRVKYIKFKWILISRVNVWCFCSGEWLGPWVSCLLGHVRCEITVNLLHSPSVTCMLSCIWDTKEY